MLAISTKSQYALLALLDLTEQYGKVLVQISDIVRRRSVPKNYLEQILNRLIKTSIVKSVRGKHGGYELGSHPDEISILKVIESLEGKIELHNNQKGCAALEELLLSAESAIKKIFEVSLSQLLERQKHLEQQPMFSI